MPTSNKTAQKHGLGRGFDSLIPTDLLDETFDPTASQDQKVSELRQIRLDQIIADPDQPRQQFDEQGLAELADSIYEHGVIQPIIVVPHHSGYQIVAGERRFRAAKMAGLDKIPALVRTLTAQRKLEISLIENLQREDLNVMETATAYQKLSSQFNLTLEEIAKKVGNKSKFAICNTMRLLKLPLIVREALANYTIVESQARSLIGLDEKIINQVFPRIVKEQWSARKVEQFVVDLKKNRKTDMSVSKQISVNPYEKQTDLLKSHLKTDVSIHTNSKGAGYISIKFKNEAEFDRVRKIIS